MKKDILLYNEIANADHILNRLKKGLNLNSDKNLAALFNIRKTTLSNWRSRNTIDYYKLFLICDRHEISLDWVVSAKGPLKINKNLNIDLLQDMLKQAILDQDYLKIQRAREKKEMTDRRNKSIYSDQSLSGNSFTMNVLDDKIELNRREIERLKRKIDTLNYKYSLARQFHPVLCCQYGLCQNK